MKQDPILPSIHVSTLKVPPKRMVPSLAEMGSPDYMIGESLIAFLLHGFCVLIVLWCMDIPKHDIPLHSTIEVAFEIPVALPIPDDTPSIEDSDQPTPMTEPSVVASEALPETDSIASIPVPQKFVVKKEKSSSQPAQNQTHQDSTMHIASANTQSTSAPHAMSQSMQKVNKILSAEERCSSLSKEYPMAAQRRHEEGVAKVRFDLLADGRINQVEVVESTGYSDLDRAAIQAVQSMKCQAAPGQPVIKTSIPVNFSLNKIN